jgi:hypothetical protein
LEGLGFSSKKMSIALAAIEQGWVALAERLFYIVQIIVKEKIPIKNNKKIIFSCTIM